MSYLHGKCSVTILSLHKEPYIPVFHFIPYLTDHQFQILKKRKYESFPISNFPVALHFVLERYLLRLSALFFPSNQIKSNNT